MAGSLQPLDQKFPVVNPDGTPTDYFTRWAQQRMDDIVAAATADQVTAAIDTWAAARLINTASPILGGGSLANDLNLSHAASGVTAGTYGDATNVAQITVNAKGHVTDVVNVPISGGSTGTVTTTGAPSAGEIAVFSGGTSITNGDLSGDVSTSGGLVVTIGAHKVTRGMLAATAGATILGSTGAGNVADLTAAQAKAFLAIVAADVGGLGYFATGTNAANLTGTVAAAQLPAMTGGDVTSPAGSAVLTIGPATITLAKMANLAANSIIGNNTGVGATPIALTAAQVKALLAIAAGDVSGLGYFATGTGASNLTGVIPPGVLASTLADQIAVAKAIGGGVTIDQSAAQVSHTGDLLEFTLATITIPANAMGANGRVEVEALFSYPSSANSKTFRIKFGGTSYMALSGTTTLSFRFSTFIANRNATNSQVGPSSSGPVTGFGTTNTGPTTSAVDTTSNVTILITGQLALNTETLKLEGYRVVLYPKA